MILNGNSNFFQGFFFFFFLLTNKDTQALISIWAEEAILGELESVAKKTKLMGQKIFFFSFAGTNLHPINAVGKIKIKEKQKKVSGRMHEVASSP